MNKRNYPEDYVCYICKEKSDKYVVGLCVKCYNRRQRLGLNNPVYENNRIVNKCKGCGELRDNRYFTKGLCHKCYEYFKKYGHFKRKIIRLKNITHCANCKKVKDHTFKAGLCGNCYEYKRKNKKNRPERLFKKEMI